MVLRHVLIFNDSCAPDLLSLDVVAAALLFLALSFEPFRSRSEVDDLALLRFRLWPAFVLASDLAGAI